MRKIVLSALLFAFCATVSAHAQAFHEPTWGARYSCSYTNYSGPSTNPGTTVWAVRTRTGSIIWGYETFTVNTNGRTDNYGAAWAKPVFHAAPDDEDRPRLSLDYTVWEYTHGVVQCKSAKVYDTGFSIVFSQCNDGHTAFCRRN